MTHISPLSASASASAAAVPTTPTEDQGSEAKFTTMIEIDSKGRVQKFPFFTRTGLRDFTYLMSPSFSDLSSRRALLPTSDFLSALPKDIIVNHIFPLLGANALVLREVSRYFSDKDFHPFYEIALQNQNLFPKKEDNSPIFWQATQNMPKGLVLEGENDSWRPGHLRISSPTESDEMKARLPHTHYQNFGNTAELNLFGHKVGVTYKNESLPIIASCLALNILGMMFEAGPRTACAIFAFNFIVMIMIDRINKTYAS